MGETPTRPRIAISERSPDGTWGFRSAAGLYKTMVHEFGHRLQREGLVDWPNDIDEAELYCSTEVCKFADFVAKRSAGEVVTLYDGCGGGYGDLAKQCRVKRGLPAQVTFDELGMQVPAGVVVLWR